MRGKSDKTCTKTQKRKKKKTCESRAQKMWRVEGSRVKRISKTNGE